MASIEAARRFAVHNLEGDLRDVCICIIGEIEKKLQSQLSPQWTFQSFAKCAGKHASDEILQQSVFLLSGAEDRKLLEMHFLFFDPKKEDAIGEVIEDDEIESAYRTGYLIDPITGQEIKNFEEFIAPFFVPCREIDIK